MHVLVEKIAAAGGERLAAIGVATGAAGFGLTLAEVGELVRIFSGLCGAFSFIAAAYYYFKKARSK